MLVIMIIKIQNHLGLIADSDTVRGIAQYANSRPQLHQAQVQPQRERKESRLIILMKFPPRRSYEVLKQEVC